MLYRLRHWVLLAGGVALCIGLALAAPPDAPLGQGMDDEQYEREVAADRARRVPQVAYLALFNSGQRKFEDLSKERIDGTYLPPDTFEESLASADHVVLLRAVRVEFVAANAADLPAARITYRVVSVGKGPLQPGAEISLQHLGGPYRYEQDGSEVMLEPVLTHTDSVGELALAILDDRSAGGYEQHDIASKYQVGADGRILEDENSVAAGIVGRGVAELIPSMR